MKINPDVDFVDRFESILIMMIDIGRWYELELYILSEHPEWATEFALLCDLLQEE